MTRIPSAAFGTAFPVLRFLVAAIALFPLFALPFAAGAAELGQDADSETAASVTATASPAADSEPPDPVTVFERLTVIGGGDKLVETPGSAHVIGEVELRRQSHTDLHRILRSVPGVVLQDEEGYGLRPHIGMRGSGIERSQKVTLLEDGVPIAPAPYSAPAAYYLPTAARMSGFEVVKGAASVRQGPFTTGGVLNMISADYPFQLGGRVRAALAEDSTLRFQALVGDSRERYSWLVEGVHFQTDGFKNLDGGGKTGFELTDLLAKLRFTSAPSSPTYQALELKVGRTDQLGHETYLGLTGEDFLLSPYRRYAASQADRIDTLHEQYQARYYLQRAGSPWDFSATVYRNEFFRNWNKLQTVGGRSLALVLDNPELYPTELAILRGEADSAPGDLTLRNNRRDYYSHGVEAVFGLRLGQRVRHDLEVGVRAHQDAEDRFQEDDRWQMLDGRMVLTSLGTPGSQANQVISADALAFFVQDRIRAGRFVLRPGLRYEHIDYTHRNYGTSDPARTGAQLARRENEVRVWVPGLGVDYLLTDRSSIFVGVHRGFAPPGPGAHQETRPEQSVSYELGYRTVGQPMNLDIIAFYSDYSNLLGRDTLAGGGTGTGEMFNGGAVRIHGLETSLSRDLAPAFGIRTLAVPARLSYTWTRSEFRSSFETSFADWRPRVERGDRMPYLPEHQLHAGIGVEGAKWSTHLAGTWTDAMRTRPSRGPMVEGERTDAYLIVDLAGSYEIYPGLRLEAQVRNLADETYIASLRPAGARPGLPRTAFLGFNWGF
jgi:Fe(3+) dicitrate transport protein